MSAQICTRCGVAPATESTGRCFQCESLLTGQWREGTAAQRVYSRFQDWRVLLYGELDNLPEDWRRALIGDLRQAIERLEAAGDTPPTS